jgi:excisionase family DNA binding protein
MTKSTKLVGLLSKEDAATYLSISDRHLRRLVAGGQIKPKRIGTMVRFHIAELDRFIAELPEERGLDRLANCRFARSVSKSESES